MGFKNVCLDCKRVESLGTDHSTFRTGDCPECSAPMYFVNQKFRPPKTSDVKSWAVAAYLISNGFTYYTIHDKSGMPVEYPTTIGDAESFVEEHRSQAAARGVRHKHEIEKRIDDLSQRPQNDSRDRLIRDLSSQLSRYG